jgi:hypothetical protein
MCRVSPPRIESLSTTGCFSLVRKPRCPVCVNQKDFIAKRWGVLASSCAANSHEAPLVPDLMSGTQ